MTLPQSLTPLLVLAAPLFLLLVGLLPAAAANLRPRRMGRLAEGAAWLAFGSALLAAATHAYDSTHTWTLWSVPLPGDLGALSLSVYVNAVTVIMLLLVSFVGVVVSRYSRNYLDGERDQGRFYKWLSLTLASILTLIIVGNLLMFALAWMATSLSLHRLLVFYRHRPTAVLAAHKKFVVSRIGDLSLLLAVLLIGSTLNTLEFNEVFAAIDAMQGPLPATLHWAAVFVVISAALKSAQLPFHGWLLQVMEAPTPVSALLHAGIVNAGAFLVIRMSPVMAQAEFALALLAIIGLVTLAVASLVMLTQTSIKVSLAWSTTAQMGFMLLECGLGLYSLAMLHLVAHSLYKAHAFLSSGSGVDAFRGPAIPKPDDGCHPAELLVALAATAAITVAMGMAFGLHVQSQPTLFAAGAIVAIAITQLLLQARRYTARPGFLLQVTGLSVVVAAAYFVLHGLFEHALADSIFPVAQPYSALMIALTAATVAVFLLLLVFQQLFRFTATPLAEAVYVHLYNGLYIDTVVTRALNRLWPMPSPQALAGRRSEGV
jgi:NAD(P)H-quinone oxidoreductase subunit 5